MCRVRVCVYVCVSVCVRVCACPGSVTAKLNQSGPDQYNDQ